jgi:hypothetical protein
MGEQQLLAALTEPSAVTFVATGMLAMGPGLTISEMLDPLRRR